MSVQDGMLEIGAGVSLEDAYAEAARHYPQELSELWQRFASMPVRNAGTLGGNVANGSPIGDSMPWLIALGAQIVLAGVDGQRVMPLEDFYLAYQKSALQANEVVQAVRIPLPGKEVRFRVYKLSKRFDQDISAVCAAFALRMDGDIVTGARIAFGGMAATPKRATQAEALLQGQAWDEAQVRAAMAGNPQRGAAGAPGRARLCGVSASRTAYRQNPQENSMNKQSEQFLNTLVQPPQDWATVGKPHPHESALLHVTGEATYTDDIVELQGTLHAALGLSQKAHARVRAIDLD
jgi:xanthine dehydrogenase iron-sulfur cluster and FAD-binding subunit A